MLRATTVQIKFPYTRKYRDRHGKVRIEYRRGGKTIRLLGDPGTAAFQASYDGARAIFEGHAAGDPTSRKVTIGTLRWLSIEYYKSAEFQQLAPNTQRARRLVFEGILRERISAKSPLLFADCPVSKFNLHSSTFECCAIGKHLSQRQRTFV